MGDSYLDTPAQRRHRNCRSADDCAGPRPGESCLAYIKQGRSEILSQQAFMQTLGHGLVARSVAKMNLPSFPDRQSLGLLHVDLDLAQKRGGFLRRHRVDVET